MEHGMKKQNQQNKRSEQNGQQKNQDSGRSEQTR